jgi:threonine dehydratase
MHHLSDDEKRKGVISLSAGNHAQALAFAAAAIGVSSTIVMPSNAVQSKVDATKGYGGEVILTDGDLLQTALDIQKKRGLTLVHPFDHLMTIAGTGTLGMEILEDVPDVDVVVVGIGGGGLISGVAAAIKQKKPQVRVIGVEPEGAPGMTLALREGKPVHLDSVNTIADGLAAPFVGQHNLRHVQEFVDDVVLVNDDQIAEALLLILERCKVLAEPAAAATYAALLSGKVSVPSGATVVCVLSGGNIDRARLKSIL